MKVTITAYRTGASDGKGDAVNIPGSAIDEAGGHQLLIAAGQVPTALPNGTKFVRVATDTAIHIKVDGAGAATTDPMMPEGSVEYFGIGAGARPSVILA